MDCYNFIEQCKNYFAMFGFSGRNQVFCATTFLKKRVLNQWQQDNQKKRADIMILLTRAEFKIFLQESLGKTRVLVDDTQRKIRNVNQYQIEVVIDQLAYMKHLQSVLKEFNSIAVPINNLLIWYFWDDLRPSIYI